MQDLHPQIVMWHLLTSGILRSLK